MFEPATLDPAVDFLEELAGDGAALELGIGTGRIALPLAARGVRVHGIDLSEAMVAKLREKPGADHIETTIGDFATTRVPGGCFVIEVGVPVLRTLPPGERFHVFDFSAEHIGIDEYDVANQGLISHHLSLRDGSWELRSLPFRYVWPAELDLMARLAGMALRERWSGWSREPFTSESTKHVSVWEKPA
ncbi:MAG: class I SAM-dependent methyltransferase [Actinobacteria bacterium]|nr:MAG: class I SAM-dependent methyltransferase [Actinomycetota bacterium]